MSNPVYNFCAGPAALPVPVMEQAQREFLNWKGTGVSVMEISHRSAQYQELANKAESDLRELMGIGDEHAVLFMHGGASLQFANIPMCLLGEGKEAEYIQNGMWSGKAGHEAARYGSVNLIDAMHIGMDGVRSLVDESEWNRTENPSYTHFTPNETIEGIRYNWMPKSKGPIIADMSSCILSEEINVNDYDMIYAGAQKNIGPAGMTIVIIKKSLMEQMDFSHVPKVFNYAVQSEQGSMVNTPPTYTWYLASLVFEWLLENGGVKEMNKRALERAEKLYACVDQDDFYTNPIEVSCRSLMNIPFILKDDSLNAMFLKLAQENGLSGLKGHRSVGGMRASAYNSMPIEGIIALTEFMQEFKRTHG